MLQGGGDLRVGMGLGREGSAQGQGMVTYTPRQQQQEQDEATMPQVRRGKEFGGAQHGPRPMRMPATAGHRPSFPGNASQNSVTIISIMPSYQRTPLATGNPSARAQFEVYKYRLTVNETMIAVAP
jgi:hypothetical protein